MTIVKTIIRKSKHVLPLLLLFAASLCEAQNTLHKVDSLLIKKYQSGNLDTNYIVRPTTKWTITGQINLSGARIRSMGANDGQKFQSQMDAEYKSTVSAKVNYMGLSLSLSLNPAKLMGRYHDYELNINSFGKRMGFNVLYQHARNFTGWHEYGGMERIELPADVLSLKTLNVNTYYVFNHRRFSYPAAFTQSYIQRRSAGSLLAAASFQGQYAIINGTEEARLNVANFSIGAGYGYNYVPSQGWLLHISALPTFIVYSRTSLTYGGTRVPLHYHFPEVIITGRGAVVRQMKKTFTGVSMEFNFTSIGDEEHLAVHNVKWIMRAFYGFRF